MLDGSELNIQADGSLDWGDDVLAGFEVLVASIHSHFGMPCDQMTQRLIRAIENPYVTIFGHPTGRSLGHRPRSTSTSTPMFRAAGRIGPTLEINSVPDRLDLDDESARLAELGARLVISTDGHSTRRLEHVRYGRRHRAARLDRARAGRERLAARAVAPVPAQGRELAPRQ